MVADAEIEMLTGFEGDICIWIESKEPGPQELYPPATRKYEPGPGKLTVLLVAEEVFQV